ncbi:hypothetical protein BGZ49_006695 [Haplosporangium sp. Z 27]|nr:hypothetical protein BGZ49_006695 [Haplosporangium sp. Z 27]
MVVQLGDTVQINDIKKYVTERKTVTWSQDWGSEKSAEFVFIPYKDSSPGFIAVEMARIKDFQKLCRTVPSNNEDWDNLEPCYEFTVTNEFKYGQNNEQTQRFLVFLDPSYKPFQHRFTTASSGTACMTTLGSLSKKWGSSLEHVAYVGGAIDIAKSIVGDDLHSF